MLPWFILILLALSGCAQAAPAPSMQAIKIYASEAGLYRVTLGELAGAGLKLAAPNADGLARLRLLHRDQDVPFEVDTESGEPAVIFYARPEATLYSPSDVYRLESAGTPGPHITNRGVAAPGDARVSTSFTATASFEQDLIYSPDLLGNSHWFWESLTAPMTKTVTVNLPGARGGAAELQVAFAGLTTGDHLVRIGVNQQPAGGARWKGRVSERVTVATARLQAGSNIVTFELPPSDAGVDAVLLDSISVTYARALTAVGNSLEFTPGPEVRVGGFTTGRVRVYDITASGAQRLTGFSSPSANGTTSIAFHDDLAGRRYIAAAASAMLKPRELRLVRPGDLRSNNTQADEVIIAPREFMDALQPLARHRAQQGVKVRLIDVEQVYDEFSFGIPDPHAIRDLLRYAQDHWGKPAPRFVLLAGKATFDYRDNLRAQNPNLVSTFLVPTPNLGEAANDDWFVSNGDDPHPALAIGRIPARIPAELAVAIGKIIGYEGAPNGADWRRRAVFVTDDKDPAFDAAANALAARLPAAIQPSKLYLSANQGDLERTRAGLVEAWNRGALLMTFVGHGSIDTWAAGPLFSSENLPQLENGGRLPILITPTCLDGFFYHPEKTSLAEALLFHPSGGVVAALAPTGLSFPPQQEELMRALWAELFEQHAPTLGEAVLRAKRKLPADTPEAREVLETFTLLGDPALQWQAP